MSEMHVSTVPAHRLDFDLSDRLGKALRVANLSAGAMAEYLGVHRNTVGNYLNGRTGADRRTMRLWALRCGVPLEWLETGTTPTEGPGSNVGYTPRDSNPEPIGLEHSRPDLRLVIGDAA